MRKTRISFGMVAAIALTCAYLLKLRNQRIAAAAALTDQTISNAVRSSSVFPH